MKKILSSIIIGLLCFSMLSVLAPQVKASSLDNTLVVYIGAHPDDIDIGMSGSLYKHDVGIHPILWIVVTDGGADDTEYAYETARNWIAEDAQYDFEWKLPNGSIIHRPFYSADLSRKRCGGYMDGSNWVNEPATHPSEYDFGTQRDWRSRVDNYVGSSVIAKKQMSYSDPEDPSRRWLYPDGILDLAESVYTNRLAIDLAVEIQETVNSNGYRTDLLYINSHASEEVAGNADEHGLPEKLGDHGVVGNAVRRTIDILQENYGFGRIAVTWYTIYSPIEPKGTYAVFQDDISAYRAQKSDLTKAAWETDFMENSDAFDRASEGDGYWNEYPTDPGEYEYVVNIDYVRREILGIPLIGQETPNSCWAASSQMVLKYYGLYGPDVSQVQIARETDHEEWYQNGLELSVWEALVGSWQNALRRLGKVEIDLEWTAPHPDWGLSFNDIVADIDLNRPIVALKSGDPAGHAVVIVGYVDNPGENDDFVILNDPDNGSGNYPNPGEEWQQRWTEFRDELATHPLFGPWPQALRTSPKVEKGEISIQFMESRSSGILRFIASTYAYWAWWTRARKWDAVGNSWAAIPELTDEMETEEGRIVDIDITENGAGNYRLLLSTTMFEQTTWNVKIFQVPAGWIRYGYDEARTGYNPYPSKFRIPNTAFENLWTSPHEGKHLMVLTGDVNGDGKLEVVKVSGDNLKVITGDGTGLWTETIPGVDSYYGTGYLRLDLLEDVTGDGVPEIFVARKVSHYQSNIYVYDGDGNRIKTLSRSVGRDGNMWSVAVFDVDRDGDKEIFCGIGSNYVGNPRGTVLFDYDTGTELWYYAAGNPISDSIADLNNDGLLEITSGWWTVHNGANGRGKGSNTQTSDSSVYVVVINENGDEIFTKQIHGTHTHGGAFEKIVDLNRDGTREIIVFHGHEPVYPGYAQIFLLDENGNELDSYTGSYNKNWAAAAIADINEDGKDEVIVGCNDGVLRVMDYDLNVIDSVNHYYGPQAINDINGDGELEIIVTDYNTKELVVLDNNLDELWKLSFPVNPSTIVSDVNGDGVNDLIIRADRLYVVSSPSRVKLPTPVFTPAIEKIPLRFAIEPYGGTWGPGANVHVEIYDISLRPWQSLTDLDQKAEDVFVASFDCNAFRNRDANPELSREEIVQNIYEAIPQAVINELYSYMPEMFVVYSVISTFNSLFANFGMEIIEGSQPSTADAFGVLTFAIPESLEEEVWVPTYIYSEYGYLDEGTWNTLGAGFGTGDLKTVSVYCLADLLIVDSLGRTISKEANEIPGAAYFESDLNQDGEIDDTVILPEIPGVEYTIWVLPEPDAPPDETFTLVLGSVDIGIPIAEDVPLSEAPEGGYELTSLFSPQETPPITTLAIGDPKYFDAVGDLYINSSTPLTLSANPGSAEVSTTAYKIYNATCDSGWISCTTPETFYLTGLDDGIYSIDYYSVDITGNIEPTKTLTLILDNTGPLITVSNPPAGWALQDGVTFTGSIVDSGSGVFSVSFSIREANDGEGIPIGFEDLPVSYNPSTGAWSFSFDTLLVPDGYYVLYVEAEDNLGSRASITVPYSIRNWAVLELLPASENNKAGRTMPVKFALRVAAAVDPLQPFVYNEELTIVIYATDKPDEILQESTFGDHSRDYRIDSLQELYITNFRTLRTPKEYVIEVYRKGMLINSFTFETVK